MPFSVDWYIENEIIYAHFEGESTVEELRDSLLTVRELIESSPRPLVHVITDVGDVTNPVGLKETLDVVREVGSNSGVGWSIILREESALVKLSVALGTSLFKSRNRTFDTLEEAEAFLIEKDPMINWDKVNKSVIAGSPSIQP
jgi:hypothetical protein